MKSLAVGALQEYFSRFIERDSRPDFGVLRELGVA
jgi:hypothetical protein